MNLKNEIEAAGTMVILGHVKPDGDCIGSATALYQYAAAVHPDMQIDLRLDEFGEGFEDIPVLNEIKHTLDFKPYDLAVCVDCANASRVGRYLPFFEGAKRRLVIDHHVSHEAFGDDVVIQPEKSSTCEVLYDLLDPEVLDRNMAISLYIGLISDTGVFKYSCTKPSSLRMAARLLEFDIPFSEIIDRSYYEKSWKVNKFIGRCVQASQLAADGRICYTVVTREMMQEDGIDRTELDGIVEQLRNTAGVEVAVFAYELSKGAYKISLRSKTRVNVAAICEAFGGGGHIRAAGASLKGDFKELFADLLKRIEEAL